VFSRASKPLAHMHYSDESARFTMKREVCVCIDNDVVTRHIVSSYSVSYELHPTH